MAKTKYYAVKLTDGQKGIFTSWPECQAFRDKNPSGAKYKGFDTREAAEAFLTGTVKSQKFYAIIAGGEKKIFESWEECQAFRDKNPSGARYKSFDARWAAEQFLEEATSQKPTHAPAEDWQKHEAYQRGWRAIAFTDGSYDEGQELYGYGVVLFDAADATMERTYQGTGRKYASARNIAGEIDGVLRAVNEAIRLGYKELVIYHDYVGLGNWARGEWSAKQPVAQNYVQAIAKLQKSIKLTFCWVPGHEGIKYNEMADQLAGEAVFRNR